MSIEVEQLSVDSFSPVWTKLEHTARYRFAAKFVEGKIVIDCACGTGVGTKRFLDGGAERIEAFDSSPVALKRAQEEIKSTKARFHLADALNLDLPSHYADVFISLETIEHLERDQEFLQEVRRVLKPTGVFVCSTPNRLVTNPGKTLSDRPWSKYHVREYSAVEFERLLKEHFEFAELYGQNEQTKIRLTVMAFLGRILPFYGAVRINQVLKLPRLLYDSEERHKVRRTSNCSACEFLVAVCR